MMESGKTTLTKDIVWKAEMKMLEDTENFMPPVPGREGSSTLKRKLFTPPQKFLPPCYKKTKTKAL